MNSIIYCPGESLVPAKRVKMDVFDSEGNKISVSFEGKISRNKVLQLLDLVELLGGVPNSEPEEVTELSKLNRVCQLLEKKFPVGWFTSQEVTLAYGELFDEQIVLSTVSTYLARLTGRGFLTRKGSQSKKHYKLNRTYRVFGNQTN